MMHLRHSAIRSAAAIAVPAGLIVLTGVVAAVMMTTTTTATATSTATEVPVVGTEAAAGRCCAILELRQYTLKPGARDTLIALFDEHFIEGQEADNMKIVGQFRDLDRPDRFVWLRGFDEMEARRVALDTFYTGPTWKTHGPAARATMVDASNALLLEPASADTTFAFDPSRRPPRQGHSSSPTPAAPSASSASSGSSGSSASSASSASSPASSPASKADASGSGAIVTATIYYFDGQVDPTFAPWFGTDVVPALSAAGTTVLAQFVTETAPNTSRRLPVRETERVFVWFARYDSRDAYEAAEKTLTGAAAWRDRIAPALRAKLRADPERLVLSPTPRSFLR